VQTIPFASSALRAGSGDLVMLIQTSYQPTGTLTRAIVSTNGGTNWYTTSLTVAAPGSLAGLHSSGAEYTYADATLFAASMTAGRTVQVV
jgi:hypothetical protein